jgi:hypothetical protein
MSSNKEVQAARNAADRRLREKFPEVYAIIMQEEHSKRGLTWTRRATAEERALREEEAKKARARARIEEEARKAGLSVSFTLPAEPEIAAVQDKERQDRIEEKVLETWDANA